MMFSPLGKVSPLHNPNVIYRGLYNGLKTNQKVYIVLDILIELMRFIRDRIYSDKRGVHQ